MFRVVTLTGELTLSSMFAIADSDSFTLTCHPQTPSQAIRKINVMVGEGTNDSLMLTFNLAGDISRLNIPESRSPRRANHLWQHTCFEIFVMEGEGPEYREFNFSPSGEWAVYAFCSYRDGGELEIDLAPAITVRRDMNRLELDARMSQDLIPQGRPVRLGLSAVVEDADGVLSYWALRHPPGKPDFHHADTFALQMS